MNFFLSKFHYKSAMQIGHIISTGNHQSLKTFNSDFVLLLFLSLINFIYKCLFDFSILKKCD